jgi:hypothetical protein
VAATVYALRGEALSTNSPGDLSAEQQVSLYDLWLRRHKGDLVDQVLSQEVDRKGTPVEVFRAS